MLVGPEQSHLLVGDGDGLRAVGRFEADFELFLFPALSGLTNLAVHERNSSREIGRRQSATEPPAGEARGAGKRGAVHPGDNLQRSVLLLAVRIRRELT